MRKSLTTFFDNWHRDDAGNVAIIFALMAVPAIGITGMAIDYARAFDTKTRLQAAVDAGATAGARLPATANQNREQAALASFNANLTLKLSETVIPVINATNSKVVVSARVSQPTTFMTLLGFGDLPITAATSARSQIENGGVACLIALNPNTPDGLHLQGINKVSSENCWAWVNSANSTAINGTGASTGTAQGFCTVGGVSGSEHFLPNPYTGCDPIDDPFYDKFASFHVPTACQHNDLELKSGTYTLQPGVYCGNTILKPHADVTLEPGLYVMRDGFLQIQAGASIKGDGVTLFFYGQNTMMEVRGGGNVDLKAPVSGDLAGFVIVDRKFDWYDPSIRETAIQGGGRIKLEGVVYAPQWKLNISGNGEVNQESKYFTMVADSFYLEGNGRLHVKSNAEAAGLPDLMPKIRTGPLLLN